MGADRLVDSSVWIEHYRDKTGTVAARLEAPLLDGELYTCGQVAAELLQGARDERQRRALLEDLGGLPWLDTLRMDWIAAADLAADCRRRGHAVPLGDCVIAAVARRHRMGVLTRDKDFLRLKGVDIQLF